MENFLKLIIAFGIGFILVVLAMPKVIPFLHKMKFGQVEREEGLESHKSKNGTPTMEGALLGFMMFNYHPAKIFMGDVGSLGLGGFLAILAILTKQELLLILVGGVFLMETLSVIIQVVSFKTRGKRVFKMAPIHHHFEMLGWSEQQVTISFWFIGFICGILSIVIGVL